ncbi:MAG: 3,4-dihydroxy-2-butanone-4-phosphate synthase, partial [Brevinema sp.]
MHTFDTIEKAISDIQEGKMIIVIDDYNRENEGDLLMSAEMVTDDAINFMATYGKGLICMPCQKEILDSLDINPMVFSNTDHYQTAFTVSIDH